MNAVNAERLNKRDINAICWRLVNGIENHAERCFEDGIGVLEWTSVYVTPALNLADERGPNKMNIN